MTALQRTPLISVVLPYRNRADVLRRAADSVLAQTFTDFELLLVDDASSDESNQVADGIGDPRVRLLHSKDRQGPTGARNLGIDAARGRFIAFQDSDDYWEPTKLHRQLAVHRELTAQGVRLGAVGCRWRYEGSSGLLRKEASLPAFECVAADRVLNGCVAGTGTPMLLLDREQTDSSVRFDASFPALAERDYLYRALDGAHVAVVLDELVRVSRGRRDHTASPERALRGFERYLDKYRDELDERHRVREWHHYSAMREGLRARKLPRSYQHLRLAGQRDRKRLAAEFGLGAVFGEWGLAVASRLRLRPDYSDRC